MKNILKKFDNHFFYLGAFTVLLIVVMLPYYTNGSIIMGGEGAYFNDFKTLQSNLNYSWQNIGVGFTSTSLNFTYFNVGFYVFLENIFSSVTIVNFIFIASVYFLTFFSMFMSCKELKINPFLSFVTAFFYLVNPFSLNFLTSINQWNSLALFIVPFFFYIILKFYNSNSKLFLFFGLGSASFAFTNANPPLMIVNHLSIFISLIFISLYRSPKFSLTELIKKYLVVLSAFILFNIWWILNWISVMTDIPKLYTQSFAISWANLTMNFPNLIWKSFALTSMIPVDPNENIFSALYNSIPSYFITLIPVLIVLYYVYKHRFINRTIYFLFASLLITVFLIKGPSNPFGFIYKAMMLYIPFFSIFKTPIEKWSVLYIFIFTLLLMLILKNLKNDKNSKLIYSLFGLYLLFCSIPLITSDFIPEYKMGDGNLASRKFTDKKEYKDLRQEIIDDPLDYRLFSLPGSLNYQVALKMDDHKFYTGIDPVLSNTNKQFIAPYSVSLGANYNILYDNIALGNFSQLLSLFNVGKIIINKDMYPWFGYRQKESIEELEEIFDKTMQGKKNDTIDLYTNNTFLPHIYGGASSTLIYPRAQALVPLAHTDRLNINPVLIFSDQQDGSSLLSLSGTLKEKNSDKKSVNEILLVNSTINDLIVDLSLAELKSDAKSASTIYIKSDLDEISTFKVKANSDFNIWIKANSKIINKIETIETGNETYRLDSNKIAGEWIRVGSITLKAGEHIITSKDRNKQIVKFGDVVLVTDEKQNEFESLLAKKDFSYFYYVDKGKAGKKAKSSKIADNNKYIKNPFRLQKTNFTTLRDNNYSIKAYISPKRTYKPDSVAVSSISYKYRISTGGSDTLSVWNFVKESTNTKNSAEINVMRDGLHINKFFEKGIGYTEETILAKRFSKKNIKENPYLAISYLIENYKVQELKVKVWLKDKNKILPKPLVYSPNAPFYVMELHKNARKMLNRNVDNLSIGKIQLVLNKYEWADARKPHIRGNYKFIFKNLKFLKLKPIKLLFENKLEGFSTDKYYYYDREGYLNDAVLFEELPKNIGKIYRLKAKNYIDLTKTQVLDLNFERPELLKSGKKQSFPKKFKVSLLLDFNGDEKEDAKIEIFEPASPLGSKSFKHVPVYINRKLEKISNPPIKKGERLNIKISAYEHVKKLFPEKLKYNLLGVTISHPDNIDTFWQEFVEKELYLYKVNKQEEINIPIGANILNVDEKSFKIPNNFKETRRDNNFIIEFNNVKLKKGKHKINFTDSKKFTVNMLEINYANKSKKYPKIVSHKINPTKYIIDVIGAKEPFTLVFSESFHEKWKAYINTLKSQTANKNTNNFLYYFTNAWKDKEFGKEVKDQFVVNSYANGWNIPVENENFQIVLEFKPQRLFYKGMTISAASLFMSIIYIAYSFIREKKE